MLRFVLKLIYFPEALGLVLLEYSELEARRQNQDEPVMILSPASGPAGY